MNRLIGSLFVVSTFLLVSCSTLSLPKPGTTKPNPTLVDRTENVIPKVEPKSKYGNPPSYEVFGRRYFVLDSADGFVEQGVASWYGPKFHGRRTSSGETYDQYAMTAAHKSLPLPSYARVTNLNNRKSIIVRINDRGPFHDNRVIDLSYAAATRLGIVARGTGLVEVRAIDPVKYAKRASGELGNDLQIIDVAATIPVALNDEDEQKLNIFVQIGAFRSQDNAERLKQQFAEFDIGELSVQQFPHEQEPIYKVWIGPLSTVEQADEAVIKLNEIGHSDHKIVFENVPNKS
jgi:rare lipoprotein A